jgi:HEPN domain-containing protein
VGFHAQQAVEKYLKALLTRHQIEFPKTHVIRRPLILLEPVDPAMVEVLDDANWLSPFGAEIRYPGDPAEALPGEEERARQLAQKVRDAVMVVLDPYVSGGWTPP